MGLIENLKSYAEEGNLSKDKKELFNSFLSKGFPTNKDEDWKYTSLKKIVASDYNLNSNDSEIDNGTII